MSRSRLRSYLVPILKIGLACALLWWLVAQASDDFFSKLWNQPKNWRMLYLATICCFISVTITIVRWMLLVRALGIHFPLRDAFRLGFQSYALNFVSLGSVGGDLFKAIFIAREQHGKRAEAVASVIIDRLVGLYALFLVSGGAVVYAWSQDATWLEVPEVKNIARITIISTIVGGVISILLALPSFTRGKVNAFAEKLPFGSETVLRLLAAIHLYRSQRGVMAFSVFISLFVHLMMAVSVWLVSKGLPYQTLSLLENFLAVPLAALVGALPITPSGLGAFEGVLDSLYVKMATPGTIEEGQGLIVALGFRVITMIVAIPGVVYILIGRRKVAEVMHEAEAEQEGETSGGDEPILAETPDLPEAKAGAADP